MIALLVVVVPAVSALGALCIRNNGLRRMLLTATAALHAGLTGAAWIAAGHQLTFSSWLGLDNLSRLFLSVTSLLFLGCSVYAPGYFRRSSPGEIRDFEKEGFFTNAPEARFTGCMLVFLSTMSLVCASRHFGLQWVAIEATTLASAPLIYYHRHRRSLEAAWKYLLISSVGIALALMGNFFLGLAAAGGGESAPVLTLDVMLRESSHLSPIWLRAAFIFFLVGYGTKMGLAPMHTWLPDAHSESPSLVSALLSGALLNCAFLCILRIFEVMILAGEAAFARDLLLKFGLLSMAVAAVFILGQKDYKRMLAYSSIEHMGILAVGTGLGAGAVFGSMLHAVNHSLTKAALFLISGNILAAYQSKQIEEIQGVARILPASGALWFCGFLAITGTPPFGLFVSEFTILKGALDAGRHGTAVVYVALLAVVFLGMAGPFIRMVFGAPRPSLTETRGATAMPREALNSVLTAVFFAVIVLGLGLYLPPALRRVLEDAARLIGGALIR